MRYSIKPRDRIYVKGYEFLSFAKNMDTYATKVAKNLSNNYSQVNVLLDSAKKFTTDAIKLLRIRQFKEQAEASGNLIGIKIADY